MNALNIMKFAKDKQKFELSTNILKLSRVPLLGNVYENEITIFMNVEYKLTNLTGIYGYAQNKISMHHSFNDYKLFRR